MTRKRQMKELQQALDYACEELAAKGLCAMDAKDFKFVHCIYPNEPKTVETCAKCWSCLFVVRNITNEVENSDDK